MYKMVNNEVRSVSFFFSYFPADSAVHGVFNKIPTVWRPRSDCLHSVSGTDFQPHHPSPCVVDGRVGRGGEGMSFVGGVSKARVPARGNAEVPLPVGAGAVSALVSSSFPSRQQQASSSPLILPTFRPSRSVSAGKIVIEKYNMK